jgi:hypothetical protein
VARRLPDGRAVIAVMAAATGFCVPFLGEYDMPILAIPGAWLIAEARRTGWRPHELPAMVLLYLAPAVITFASDLRIPLAPVAMLLLLVLVVHRIPAARRSVTGAGDSGLTRPV